MAKPLSPALRRHLDKQAFTQPYSPELPYIGPWAPQPNYQPFGELNLNFEEPAVSAPENPLHTGIRMGLTGSRGGANVGDLQQQLQQAPSDAKIRPLLVGALIGTLLGVGGSIYAKRKLDQAGAGLPVMPARLRKRGQYDGLRHLAFRKNAQLGAVADVGTYFIPGVGQLRSAWDAAQQTGAGLSGLAHGDWRKGLGNLGMAAGTVGLGLLTAGMGRGFMKLLGKGLKSRALGNTFKEIARHNPGAMKALPWTQRLGMRAGHWMPKRWAGSSGLQQGAGHVEGLLGLGEDVANRLPAWMRGWKGMGAGFGVSMGGGMLAASSPNQEE